VRYVDSSYTILSYTARLVTIVQWTVASLAYTL
jgi:hypothetical protein